jgi:FkbM family methyltransferase
VFDIGASVGPFTVSILDKKPKEIHCFEPHNSMFSVMQSNLSDVDNVILNKFAISDKTTRSVHLDSVFSLTKEENEKTVDTITFMDYIKKHNITKIDFLKTDCEGGEWYVFTKENYEWIRNNVKKVTGEFHLHTDEMKKSFIEFRDLYLKNAKNVVAFLSNKFAEIELIDISNDDFVNNNLQYCNISFELESVNFMSINTQPKKTAWIVDNFYEHPDRVRDFALRQEYLEGGLGRGFIGRRTHNQFLFPGLKERFQEIMGKTVTKWQEHGMNGRFQISWSGEPLVYHCDDQRWAGMLYLTPNAPFQCGTTLHGHKVTKARTYYDHGWDAAWRDVPGDPHLDGTPFEPVDVLGNVYNRLVIFDASCIHSASEYFGTVKENARLWQMFFFDAE